MGWESFGVVGFSEFLSGGYNLHLFSDALGLVSVCFSNSQSWDSISHITTVYVRKSPNIVAIKLGAKC